MRLRYNAFFPFSLVRNFRNVGLTSRNNSADSPTIQTMTKSFILDRRKAPVTSAVAAVAAVATSLPSNMLMKRDRMNASSWTVGEVMSSFLMYVCCLRPSSQTQPLILPQHFFFIIVMRFKAIHFCFLVNLFGSRPSNVVYPLSCTNSASTTSIADCPKRLIPLSALS